MDITAASKRKRSDEPDADGEDGNDSVIGLDVGGQLFYTHKSTLTAGSTYFAARFGGNFNAGSSYVDERGRKVYFIDGNGELFVHVLDYLRRGIASWPDQADNPKFHKRLVAEAEYFGVEAMVRELLMASISPNESGKGILYWLGTNRGTTSYRNPFVAKDIKVDDEDDHVLFESNAYFFGYRPPCSFGICNNSQVLNCTMQDGKSRECSFANIRVRPSHYSLRYGQCHGMSDWNFEASVDGINWDCLHKARKERGILQPSEAERESISRGEKCDELEKHHRQVWPVNSSSYYKHFRFTSLTDDEVKALYGDDDEKQLTLGPDGRCLWSPCLHGVGFELYGDVLDAD